MPGTPVDPGDVGNASANATANASLGTPDFVVRSGAAEQGVTVEQGPVWLAQVLVDPPAWLAALTYGVLAVAIAAAAWKVHRSGLDAETKGQMARNAVVGVCVIAGTYGLVQLDVLPYVGDVLVGGIGSYWVGDRMGGRVEASVVKISSREAGTG